MQGRIRELARDWAHDPKRPRINRDVANHWDNLLQEWVEERDLPILVRKFSAIEGRGSLVTHVSGRKLVPADNSPAHWTFALAYAGLKPAINDVQDWFDGDAIPIAWIFKSMEKEAAKYFGENALIRDLTKDGWKVCHKLSIGLGRRGSIADVPQRQLERHFISFLSPSNIFVVPKSVGGLGELPQFIEAISHEFDI